MFCVYLVDMFDDSYYGSMSSSEGKRGCDEIFLFHSSPEYSLYSVLQMLPMQKL